ncbi:MAG TPA: LysM peptidoglycan-binding domain-containing protein [Chloroflexota bacterium]|nr:LysM peptidoglycan-binding domain-containing protein [Chloroflexota bacterium]
MHHLVRPQPPALASRTRSIVGGIAIAASIFATIPAVAFADSGRATWYGPGFQGNVMYDGQTYNMYDPTTTACNIYPMGTWLKVSNPANGRSVVVQVRDRGAFPWAFDLSYAAFKILANPAEMMIRINYQVVSGPGGQPITPAPSRQLASKTLYLVQPGDTLSDIASSFNIDQNALAQWNGITDPNSLIQGQTLRLTAPAASATVVAADAAYRVKLGDTLLDLSAQFGVPVEELAAANNLSDPYVIVEGQALVIPASAASPGNRVYTVQPGDTISGIASSLGVSPDNLATLNQIADPQTIQPGQALQVPAS